MSFPVVLAQLWGGGREQRYWSEKERLKATNFPAGFAA